MLISGGLAKRIRAVLSIFLILLLASLSHRSSPVSGRVALADGKTPCASRRAQLSDTSARVTIKADAERDQDVLAKTRHPVPLADICASTPCFPRVDSKLSSVEAKPDYLNFFQASLPQNYLSPPV
jgi:hypothetical protein